MDIVRPTIRDLTDPTDVWLKLKQLCAAKSVPRNRWVLRSVEWFENGRENYYCGQLAKGKSTINLAAGNRWVSQRD